MATATSLQRFLEHDVPAKFRVPGAATAVLKDGEVIAKHVWGYANIDTRAPVTPSTVFPICSISKQMVCLVLTELIAERGPEFAAKVLEAVQELLPRAVISDKDLTLERLVAMQSGLRDYWVLTVLWGATPQDRFSIYQDTPRALKRLGGFHFAPGTQMSYSNTNFAAVGLAIEKVTGERLGDLLQERVFGPAGMNTAALIPDTSRIPQPLVGYEGSETAGYIPYANRIEWAGDAGVMASLDDMIAYEKYVDRSSSAESSSYSKNAQDPTYIDGKAANYGFGLLQYDVHGVKVVSHSGGLAGFRLRRAYVPTQRLSIIVLLNSETDSKAVLEHVLKKILPGGATAPLQKIAISKPEQAKIEVGWTGHYFDDDAKLAVVVKQEKPGEVVVNYAGHDEKLRVQSASKAASAETQIRFEEDGLKIDRPFEHRFATARRLAATTEGASIDAAKFAGKYYSEEIDSTFHVTGTGGMLYGAFDGFLGQGPAHLMRWLGEGVWWLACFRSLDASPPGNWTVAFEENSNGEVGGVTVGCWLARKVEYKKVE